MNVRFYTTPGGSSPVERYLADLEAKERANVLGVLDDIRRNGLEKAQAKARQIEGKLWEIKVSRHRVFYVTIKGPEMILLHAYKKQGQKAPRREIDLALARMKEVLSG